MAVTQNITIVRRDTVTLQFTITDDASAVVDVTGGKLYWTAKTQKTDADLASGFQASGTSFTDPANGVCQVTASKSDTDLAAGNFWYDVQYIGAGGEITTIQQGLLTIEQDITIADT